MSGLVAPWCGGYHYCTTSFNKAWNQVLRRFKSSSERVGDSRWWRYLTVILARNEAKHLLSIWPAPPCGFSKSIFSKEREKPCFFVTSNIILRHIFPENFIEFPQVVQKIWRNSLSILANFHQFSSIFWIFWHYLVTKKLMASAYNRWCQHFFTFNIF